MGEEMETDDNIGTSSPAYNNAIPHDEPNDQANDNGESTSSNAEAVEYSVLQKLSQNPPPDALPEDWIMHRSRSQIGQVYYFNKSTGLCQWEAPQNVNSSDTLELTQGLTETLNSITRQQEMQKEDGSSKPSTSSIHNSSAMSSDTATMEPSKTRSILKKSFTATNTNSNATAASTATTSTTTSSSDKHHGTKRRNSNNESSSSNKKHRTDKVRIRHILKKHNKSRRPSSWRQPKITINKEEAKEELRELLSILQESASASGEDDDGELEATFIELAKTESDCSSAKRGGDLDWFGRKAMHPPFEKASFALKVGELSGVVETKSGVHILLRIG